VRQRRSINWLNSGAAILALSVSTYAALAGVSRPTPPSARAAVALGLELTTLPDGRRALLDATGSAVPIAAYARIASGSLLADPLLLELCEPARIVAFSGRAPRVRDSHRYAGKPHVDATRRMEEVIALAPDLVLVNSLGEHAWVNRLRESGLTVFDLGPMWGLETFLRNVMMVGLLVGRPDAARDIAWRFEARLNAVASHLAPEQRRKALYVGVFGNQMFGGTRGSSYHDVLTHAGLLDAAAERFQGWPTYNPELLLTLDPEVIVSTPGARSSLCGRAELSRLRACGPAGRFVEIDSELASDAGFGMLEAAEQIHAAVYGDPVARGARIEP
jgi:iron complex transport system substrate-binding protein